MKRTLALIAVLTFICSVSFGQNAYMKGSNLIHGGIGFGLAGVFGDATIPPITAGYEFGFEDKISLGGLVGYSGSTFSGFGWEWKYSYILFGARGAYHFLENNSTWDAYGGVLLGYNIVSVSETGTAGFGFSAGTSYMLFGFYGGGRYYLNPRLALYGELGYGAGFVTVGVAYKL
ncbi:MAG: hypothetical protein HYW57_02755 [Ignavibacteriales bacterium]|nr:hypothetical protein [Ignavibacteriales bacterium]